jgi:lipid-binding SYLF domain-containing protein
MRRMNSSRLAAVTAGLYGFIALAVMSSATAETTAQIDAGVKGARDQCAAQIPGCNEAAEKAAGMLVFPEVTKAAVGVGGSYGERLPRELRGGRTALHRTAMGARGSFWLTSPRRI